MEKNQIDEEERAKFLEDECMVVDNEKNETDIIEKSIGSLGKWQIATSLILGLVKFPVAWHQLSIVFLAPPTDFVCTNNQTAKCAENCTQHEFDRHLFTETMLTQWDLVCDRSQLANLAQTVTMLGILIGNVLFGYLSDKFGRRSIMIVTVLLQILSGTLTAFVPWFYVFVVLRFITAVAVGGAMVASFVLVMEIIGLRWRTTFGILYQIPFTLGHITLPGFAYFFRDWRYFQIAISLPATLLVSYYWILPESPRWLLSIGKSEKAVAVLSKAADYNKLPTSDIKENVNNYMQKRELNKDIGSGNFIDLVKSPIIRIYTICIGFSWFTCGMCFFGFSQFIGQLGGNIFVNVALSAVTGIPGTLFSIWAVKALGRKRTIIFSHLVSGSSGIITALVSAELIWLRATLSGVGMFGLSAAFCTVYIYSGELYPTVIRNIGVGTSSMFARIGSMIAPFVAGLVLIQNWLPPLIFGITPLIAVILCFKLPETLDCILPDTIEEAEELSKTKLIKSKTETEMKQKVTS